MSPKRIEDILVSSSDMSNGKRLLSLRGSNLSLILYMKTAISGNRLLYNDGMSAFVKNY